MIIKKKVTQIVTEDLKEIAFWYNRQSKGLGMLFLNEIKREVYKITKAPLAYEVRYADIRIAFIRKFPYGIHFEYFEEEKQVNILAVFHTSQNPESWQNI